MGSEIGEREQSGIEGGEEEREREREILICGDLIYTRGGKTEIKRS